MTQMTHYYHHAPSGNAAAAVLASVEKYLTADLPSMFDFSVYS